MLDHSKKERAGQQLAADKHLYEVSVLSSGGMFRNTAYTAPREYSVLLNGLNQSTFNIIARFLLSAK